ncbi:hypothetical protein KY366_02450, partial [Candidatus Woesearchaeota archaeon]|nr:hypothetical protein [Candidatus Woesearchaeota archaeon]
MEVEHIGLSSDIAAALAGRPEIDTTSKANDTYSEEIALAQYNMALALANLNIYVRRGFAADNEFDLPIITCGDATPAVPVIYFMKSDQTNITMQGGCIIAEARSGVDILRMKDRMLYSALGIMR